MKNKKWKEFEKLTEKCYANMAMAKEEPVCWHKAYGVLKEIIADGRDSAPEYAAELYQLDEDTDYSYDVQGWLEDYLDEVDMQDDNERLIEICDELLSMFQWKEDKPSDIKLIKSSAMRAAGRMDDAAEFCRQWLADDPGDLSAVTANIYADTAVGDMETAGKLIKQHIHEDTQCTEENDILFTAAAAYYRKAGNKEEEKRINQALEAYEEYLKSFFEGDDGEGGFSWGGDVLPFN